MKKILIVAVFMAFCANLMAQTTNDEISSAVISLPKYCCKMGHPTIENALAYTKGVTEWQINPEAKCVMVSYNTKKISVEKIEKALAKAGIETENQKANKRAIEKLPGCCKRTAKGESKGMDKD